MTDKFRNRLDPHGRTRFDILVMYSLVALVLVGLAVLMNPAGPFITIDGPLFTSTPTPCIEEVFQADAFFVPDLKCEGNAEGRLQKIDDVLWYVCECPDRNYSFDSVP